MKVFTQFSRIIAVLMIFILLLECTGCYDTRILTSQVYVPSDLYYIHYKKSTYKIDSLTISDGILAAKIKSEMNNKTDKNNTQGNVQTHKSKPNKNHIYLTSGTVLDIENNILKVPAVNISRIEQKVPNPRKTTALIVGCTLSVVLSVLLAIAIVNGTEEAVNFCNSY